jgi:hypothetical protein
MPRPPILATLDWRVIFSQACRFADWLDGAESADQAAAMRDDLAALRLEPHETAWLAALGRTVHVVAFAEDWCGDVVRHVPVLEAMARDSVGRLQPRYVRRADHPDAFVRFLTNGGEAIPKFVFLSDDFVECGHWGPMPAPERTLIARGKACGDVAAARRKVAELYAADPERRRVVAELLEHVAVAAAGTP